jgi:hypothetical protein
MKVLALGQFTHAFFSLGETAQPLLPQNAVAPLHVPRIRADLTFVSFPLESDPLAGKPSKRIGASCMHEYGACEIAASAVIH